MLTDMQCRKAVKRDKDYKLADANGLYLFVTKAGFRSWRLKYRIAGKEKTLTFGAYPEVTLTSARAQRDAARDMIRTGIDPAVHRKQRAAEAEMAADTTMRSVTTVWHAAQAKLWKPRYAEQVMQRFENHVFPMIGAMPITSVTPALALKVVTTIEERETHETAHRVRQQMSDVFVFAIAKGWAADDPAHVIRKALVKVRKRLRPAVTRLAQVRHTLATIEQHPAYAMTRLSSRLLALTAARPGVVRMAAPEEFEGLDGAEPIWRIPAAKMKLTREQREDITHEFLIPLSRQAVEVVRAALELAGPKSPLLFPSSRHAHKPLSDSTLSKLYRDVGLTGVHVPHGWRSSFSTLMNQRAAEQDRERDREVINLMLAHMQAGVEPIYNRYLYMPRRRILAQEWADLLIEGAAPVEQLIEGQRGSSARSVRRRAHDRRLDRSDRRTPQGQGGVRAPLRSGTGA